MSDGWSKCANCGHPFSEEHPFYSADFARYFSPTETFSLTWCYSCASVLIHHRPFIYRVTRLRMLRFKAVRAVPAARETRHFRERDPEIGFFAGAHLMRMVWHCLCERVEINGYRGLGTEAAMHLALKKLPAREVALMAAMTVHAPEIVPLERQLMEGKSLRGEFIYPALVRSWIESSPDMYPRLRALQYLEGMLKSTEHQ